MNEKTRKVFDLLGVEPNEEFKIGSGDEELLIDSNFAEYLIDDELRLKYTLTKGESWIFSELFLGDLITEKIKIIKLPKLTEADKNAIKYLRDGGMKYVARDKDGWIWGHRSLPTKDHEWSVWRSEDIMKEIEIFKNLFQFVQWTDEEPFCIECLEV